MKIGRTRYLYDALLFLAAVALYAPSLRYGFVGDDLIYFVGNRYIESFDVRTILGSGAIGADYLPLRDLSLALDYLLWGRNPFGFHLTNVVLYGMTAAAVRHLFVSLNSFLGGPEIEGTDTTAFLAAMLFALHPTHRDVVCAVYNRGALLTVLFSILSLIFFLDYMAGRRSRYRSYAAAFCCYLAALLSREYSIILPLALALLIPFGERSRRTTHLMHLLPFFITAALFFLIYKKYALAAAYISPQTASLSSDLASKFATAAKIPLFYIIRMVTFAGKFSEFDGMGYALLSAVIVAGIFTAAVMVRRRHPNLLFGLLLYLICLIPVLNLFKTEPVVAARYSYLPCLGLFFALMSIPFKGKKITGLLLSIVFTLAWGTATAYQMKYYENNIAYWENTVPYVRTPAAYAQLGYAYYREQQYEKAFEALIRVQPPPMDPGYHAALGNTCFTLGDYKCAAASLDAAIALGTNDASVALGLERAYTKLRERGREEAAIPGRNEKKLRPDEKADSL